MHRKHGIILKAVITVCSAAFLVTGCGKADSLYDKGMDYIKDKDYKQALECFDDAIAVNNEKAEYYIASGMAYNYLGKYQDAIKRFSKAFQSSENSISNTNNKQLYYGEAISYYGINDYDKVIDDCKRALDIKQVDNLNNKINCLMASAYQTKGDVKKAKEIYDSVIKSNNKYAKAYIMRAGLYRDTKDYDNAQKDLTKAIDLEEKNVDAYFELYNVYKLKKDDDSATGILNKVIDMVASDESMYIPAGKAYYYQGKYDDAMEMFNSAEKNGEADAIYYKGVVYAKKGDNKSALKQYKEYADKESALAKATKKSDVYDKIAKCYMLEEDYDNALLYVRKGLKEDDQTAGVKLLKKQVILYEKTGNYKDALKCAREYVKTYPDDKEMKKEVRFIKTRI